MTSARLSDNDIRSVFEVFDVDGTGFIDAVELLTALRSLGWTKVTETDVEKIIKQAQEEEEAELDLNEAELKAHRSNRKLHLNYSQFSDLVRNKQRAADGPEEVLAAFRLFDADHKGRISFNDLKVAGKIATGKEVQDSLVNEILRLADWDKDGFLTFDEFRKAVSKGDAAEATLTSTVMLGATITNAEMAAREARLQKEAESKMDAEDQKAVKAEEHVIAGVKVSVIGGRLAKTEVRRALVVCGYTHDTLPTNVFEELFAESDADNDGLLTLDEYCKLLVGFGESVDGY